MRQVGIGAVLQQQRRHLGVAIEGSVGERRHLKAAAL